MRKEIKNIEIGDRITFRTAAGRLKVTRIVNGFAAGNHFTVQYLRQSDFIVPRHEIISVSKKKKV